MMRIPYKVYHLMYVIKLSCMCRKRIKRRKKKKKKQKKNKRNKSFFLGKLTYVLKEKDTKIIRGIPQIYNENKNIKQQMATS